MAMLTSYAACSPRTLGANALIAWGKNDCHRTHPLHYVSDMLFNGTLPKGHELPLIDALLEAGADPDFRKEGKGETALIGAASLGAEDVGLRLLEAGARPEMLGMFGESALHWAAMLGEDRLVERLIAGSDLDLKDAQYQSPPLGWAIHGWSNAPAGNHGRQREVVALLVAAGARIQPEWLEDEKVRADAAMVSALRSGSAA
jgi:ankyrin repeat protein